MGFVAIVLLLALGCSYFGFCHDSRDVIEAEQRDLHRGTMIAFNHDSPTPLLPLPKPLAVSVSGRDATLTAGGPISPGSLQYAQLWYEIYGKHHWPHRTVHLHVKWNSGSVDQTFPLSEF